MSLSNADMHYMRATGQIELLLHALDAAMYVACVYDTKGM